MAIVPAACDNCGLLFGAPNIIGGSGNITFSNCGTNCPNCGGMARILDGTYRLIEDTIEVIQASKRTLNELNLIAEALKSTRHGEKSHEEISQTVKENIPELSSIFDALPKTRGELYTFISIIITILSLLINAPQSNVKTKIEVNQVINNIYYANHGQGTNQYIPQYQQAKSTNDFRTIQEGKIKRNSLCPCGSGKKYKKCCLD